MGVPLTTIVVLGVAGEEDVPIYKWHSISALMMLIDRVWRKKIQVLTFKFSVLKQRISNYYIVLYCKKIKYCKCWYYSTEYYTTALTS